MRKNLSLVFVLLSLGVLCACTDLDYYFQCARGHVDVMARTRPIEELVEDPQTTAETRQELAKILEIRSFAVTELGLPDNGSYRHYADIGRPYVVWNVVATPEFSLTPKEWCFPVAGCVSYRGYFDQTAAETLAEGLRAKRYDVDVYGVQAYSTLGWFSDPVLNTFLSSSEGRLAGILFHELAHQVVYLAGDSAFNEAFAKTVEIEGVRRWFHEKATADGWQQFLDQQVQVSVFQDFLRETRDQFSALYRRPLAEDEMRAAKRNLVAETGEHYTQLKNSGQLDGRFDGWMSRGLNNARLASVATYQDLVPGFQAILQECHGKLGCFYTEVAKLSKLPKPERLARLQDQSRTERHAFQGATIGRKHTLPD